MRNPDYVSYVCDSSHPFTETGYALALNPTEVRVRFSEAEAEHPVTAVPLEAPFDNPLSYLIAVVRGEVEPAGMSSLAANVIVTEILDAARRSAATGETVGLDRR